jgi:hypothetical protein
MTDKPPANMVTMIPAVMDALVQAFPGCAITLLVAPYNAPEGSRTNYASTGSRADMIAGMKEIVARFEGRVIEAPERPQ